MGKRGGGFLELCCHVKVTCNSIPVPSAMDLQPGHHSFLALENSLQTVPFPTDFQMRTSDMLLTVPWDGLASRPGRGHEHYSQFPHVREAGGLGLCGGSALCPTLKMFAYTTS